MQLVDYAAIAAVIWPSTPEAYIMNKAALVRDVELGEPCPTMSRAEREHIERLLAERREQP